MKTNNDMKNIHVLPTDKPSRLFKHQLDEITLNISKHLLQRNYGFNTYITSDEEIKEGDWCLDTLSDILFISDGNLILHRRTDKKIILTTDQDLIKDGVQAIDDEFLQWFVKNPSCEWVEVHLVPINEFGSEITVNGYGFDKFIYKIIIPKEEPKQDLPIVNGSYGCVIQTKKQEPKQETLEEFAENYLNKFYSNYVFKDLLKPLLIAGAKWQAERMYSEEDMRKSYIAGLSNFKKRLSYNLLESELSFEEWFEQFKKK